MKIICAWCKKTIKKGEESDEETSHSICTKCRDKALAEANLKEEKPNGHTQLH